MPHFTIEYSANLEPLLDMGKVVEVVRKAAAETGIFPLGGIRVGTCFPLLLMICHFFRFRDM